MKRLDFLLLATYVAGMFVGQMLFKRAAVESASAGLGLAGRTLALLMNPVFLLALALYFALAVAWIGILQIMPMSRAYPVVALNFALVPLAGVLWYAERLSVLNFLGIALIVVGILLVTLGD